MKEQHLNIPHGGDSLPAILWGKESGRCLIGVHGSGSHKRDDVLRLLAERAERHGWQTLTFDLPAHGERRDGAAPTPARAAAELKSVSGFVRSRYPRTGLFACSLGAYFSLLAYGDERWETTLFLSPVVSLEALLKRWMEAFGVSEERLERERRIPLPVGQTLDWDDYRCVLSRPVPEKWNGPLFLLRGQRDEMIPREDIDAFAGRTGAEVLTVEDAGHYFHTAEELGAFAAWADRRLEPAGK